MAYHVGFNIIVISSSNSSSSDIILLSALSFMEKKTPSGLYYDLTM